MLVGCMHRCQNLICTCMKSHSFHFCLGYIFHASRISESCHECSVFFSIQFVIGIMFNSVQVIICSYRKNEGVDGNLQIS